MIKIISWNINGIRAVHKKGFLDWLSRESPDIVCLQEIKAQEIQVPAEIISLPGSSSCWNSADRPGYSGVATLSRKKPLVVKRGIGVGVFDCEGRVLETEFEDFTLLNIYFPNGGRGPERLQFKLDFYDQALKYFLALRKKGKKLVISGDYNTAHQAIDLKNPKENENTSGFMPVERAWLDRLIAAGFVDTFREFNQAAEQYSWWDMRTRARERNAGWRIDYHFISEDLRTRLADAFITPDVMGSDHCPVGILLKN